MVTACSSIRSCRLRFSKVIHSPDFSNAPIFVQPRTRSSPESQMLVFAETVSRCHSRQSDRIDYMAVDPRNLGGRRVNVAKVDEQLSALSQTFIFGTYFL
jgi:hypothetical protein